MEETVTEPVRRGGLALHPTAIVRLLGLSQIIGYGTLYYSFSILTPGGGLASTMFIGKAFAKG